MRKIQIYSLILLLLFGLFSCQKDATVEISSTINPQNNHKPGMMVLGKKLENPYTVANMNKAYENLVSAGILKSGLEITATHIYIRYLPANQQELYDFETYLLTHLSESELELLENEVGLYLFDYPLDYEIEEGGNYYYDPQLPPGGITWQYAAIPVDLNMPSVNYEVIDSLYLNNPNGGASLKSGVGLDPKIWDLLETEALTIAGDPHANITGDPGLKNSSWTPSGRIRVFDDILGQQIPLNGVKVRARRWFITHSGVTDSIGSFSVNGTFPSGRPANYSIIWERADWDIVAMNFELLGWWQAYFNGPKQTAPWNLDISSDKSLRYATIHRALHRYFYQQRLGLKTPYNPAWYQWKMKVGYSHNAGTSNAIPYLTTYGRPHAEVYGCSSGGTWRSTNTIFALTIHEVAHVSHYDLIGRFSFSELWANANTRIIPESWAEAVEWGLTNLEYNTLGNRFNNTAAMNYNHNHGLQFWNTSGLRDYTPMFIDLIDNINQRLTHGGGSTTFPPDDVTGYSFNV
ncbi:MAG: hypothetical protein Q8M23_01705, partial [Bacteroidales bacterium]|nr:hypothetical protein [Bacteroidales bacterium]